MHNCAMFCSNKILHLLGIKKIRIQSAVWKKKCGIFRTIQEAITYQLQAVICSFKLCSSRGSTGIEANRRETDVNLKLIQQIQCCINSYVNSQSFEY